MSLKCSRNTLVQCYSLISFMNLKLNLSPSCQVNLQNDTFMKAVTWTVFVAGTHCAERGHSKERSDHRGGRGGTNGNCTLESVYATSAEMNCY